MKNFNSTLPYENYGSRYFNSNNSNSLNNNLNSNLGKMEKEKDKNLPRSFKEIKSIKVQSHYEQNNFGELKKSN
ncbi:hypothetical protein J4474_00505 [Candidatus Pacearchaeota archaeon]|nr:hypothetical protein [Candidatus Pacearchaeota archaeon]